LLLYSTVLLININKKILDDSFNFLSKYKFGLIKEILSMVGDWSIKIGAFYVI